MNKFGFIAHPIDTASFYDFLGAWGRFAKKMPERVIRDISNHIPPYKLCSYNNIRSKENISVAGVIVSIPRLPIQIASAPEEEILSLIEKGIKLCVRRGAQIVGLGGFTSVVGNEGEALSRRVSVPLTSGNTFTASLALDGIFKAAHLMELVLSGSTIAVIGATGDIGSICTKILSRKCKKLNIAARNEDKLQEFAAVIKKYGKSEVEVFKYTKDAVKDADIILSATSAVSTIIEPEYLKSGAIICDVSLPANIAREVTRIRNDVFVFEGGLAKIAYPEDIKNARLKSILPGNSIYGCAAETMTLTFEGKFEPYSIGRGNIKEEKIYEIKDMAAKYGITLSDFFCGYKFYTNEDINGIKMNAKKNKERMYVTQR
jgi:predicted amino acid dehydrogenase